MRKLLSVLLQLLLFLIVLSCFNFAQSIDDPKTAKEFVDKNWGWHLAKCGDSNYFFRREVSGDETLFEVHGTKYETGFADNVPNPALLRSGNSIASFQSYRKMVKDSHTWSEWMPGGAESFLFEYDKTYGWITVPHYLPDISCTAVKVFTGELGEGQMLPQDILNAPIKPIDGEASTLKERKGVVLLYLWATWCGPCRLEIPDLTALQNQYHDRGFTVIGLDVDPEPEKMVKAYGQRMGINFPLAIADRKIFDNLLGLSRVAAIPQAFIVANGRLVKIFKGYEPNATKPKMIQVIEEALALPQK
jgi:thiol-disulfide isomerase/thioredoxin